MRQSPVDVGDVKSIPVLDSNHQRTTWSYSPLVSNGSNVEVISNGNYLQASPEWTPVFEENYDALQM